MRRARAGAIIQAKCMQEMGILETEGRCPKGPPPMELEADVNPSFWEVGRPSKGEEVVLANTK